MAKIIPPQSPDDTGITAEPWIQTDRVIAELAARRAEAEVARLKAEAALIRLGQSERRYRLLTEKSSDLILHCSDQGVIEFASMACGDLGYSPASLVETNLFKMIHPDDRRPEWRADGLAGSTGWPAGQNEFRLRRSDGQWVWMEGTPAVTVDDDGGPTGFVIVLRDLTKRKALEDELLRQRAEAEAALAVKSEFISNMSHELRSPLTSIIGFTEILTARSALSGADHGYLSRIHEASSALLATINDILDFSKLEGGHVEIERRSVDVGDLGARSLAMFEPQLEKKGLFGHFEQVGSPPFVVADDTRLRQILLNLIGNAVKFTSRGGIDVRGSYDTVRSRLRYEVTDTGLGIPPQRLSRLFQRFSQVDASTTRSFGGTGLGLAICKGLIDAMGGEIGVDSTPGSGSCFWFEVPASPAEPELAKPVSTVDMVDITGSLQGLRLLLVDDNSSNRELARLISEPFGVIVTEAAGGAEAASAAQLAPFDLILMDIRMPDVDGPTATQILRSQPGPNVATPVVAFTAEAMSEMPLEWNGLFADILAKPVVAADLLLALCHFGRQSVETDQSGRDNQKAG